MEAMWEQSLERQPLRIVQPHMQKLIGWLETAQLMKNNS